MEFEWNSLAFGGHWDLDSNPTDYHLKVIIFVLWMNGSKYPDRYMDY